VVRAGISATLRDYLGRYPGIQLDRLALSAGVDPAQLGKPDAFLDQQHWFTLVEAAARATGDGYFAIGFVEQMPWKDFGVLAYVGFNSATVGNALENLARYFAVQQTGGGLEIERGRDTSVTYVVDDPGTDHGQIAEGLFALLTRLLREALGDPAWKPRAIGFRHDPPTRLDRHVKFFGVQPRYHQRANKLTLASSDLERRFARADPDLLPHLLAHAAASIAAMPKPGANNDVHRAVIAALGAGDPTIERVASTLGLSPRSLQRRLQAEGRSFKEVVDDTRLDLAKRYLKDATLTLTETAFLLGYSDLSAFSRAFRRWTDISPLEFRSRANERR
jgi:AraC-like DNA-binding protein